MRAPEGLTNLDYAPLCEIMGRSHGRRRCSTAPRPTPATWKCWSATARPEQKKQWLEPLLAGEIRSAFAMTEPDVASSDATNVDTRIESPGATSTSSTARSTGSRAPAIRAARS
jgi:acyl-CoA dehydrogenase